MANYKLTYHNLRAIAEPIRFIFHYANVEFEDHRLDNSEWPTSKENYPWGLLPLLEVDGKKLSQSFSIGRYLGKTFKLNGKDDYESAKCDEYGDAVKDLLNECRQLFFETDETRKSEIRENILNVQILKYFGQLEKNLADSDTKKYLVGESHTWIDFYVAYYADFLELRIDENILDKYPNLKAFRNHIYNLPRIKAWLEKRPVTIW